MVEVAQEEIFQRLFRFPGFDGGVPCQALRNTALRSKRISIKAGQILFSRGETVTQHYFLLKGRLDFCIEREDDGIINHIGSAGAGAVLGAFPLIGDDSVRRRYRETACAGTERRRGGGRRRRCLGRRGRRRRQEAAARTDAVSGAASERQARRLVPHTPHRPVQSGCEPVQQEEESPNGRCLRGWQCVDAGPRYLPAANDDQNAAPAGNKLG